MSENDPYRPPILSETAVCIALVSFIGLHERRPSPAEHALLRVDFRDLVALDSNPGHQSLLTEDERVDVILHGRGLPQEIG